MDPIVDTQSILSVVAAIFRDFSIRQRVFIPVNGDELNLITDVLFESHDANLLVSGRHEPAFHSIRTQTVGQDPASVRTEAAVIHAETDDGFSERNRHPRRSTGSE